MAIDIARTSSWRHPTVILADASTISSGPWASTQAEASCQASEALEFARQSSLA